MTPTPEPGERLDVEVAHHLPPDHLERSLRTDVRAGLGTTPKTLPPKWFYDERGSELFEQITALPEYYPTRAEREVLERHAAEIATAAKTDVLVELGSGSSRKTPLLLDAMASVGDLRGYVAVDVSESALLEAAKGLRERYPTLPLRVVVADFEHQLHLLGGEGRRLVAFLGGTVGNLEPGVRGQFLRGMHDVLGEERGAFLLGTDLVKSREVLVRAYDDASGVTAEFNKNVLRVLNRELGADFDIDSFEHVAVWRPDMEWMEMRLRATRSMDVRLPGVDMTVHVEQGEEIRTEVSAKFRLGGVARELADAGMNVLGQWADEEHRYALTLAAPAED